MPSPFPGFDPYLESQRHWPDFHPQFIADCRVALNMSLPARYVARIDERITLIERTAGTEHAVRPDVSILRETGFATARGQPGTVALEPVTIPLDTDPLEEVRETRIEIVRLPEQELITVIEVLSPTNKNDPGRAQYLAKRNALLRQAVSLVELDLLSGGERLPLRRPLPPAHYYALVARSEQRPNCDVFAWSIQQPLPTIPIPLKAPEPPVLLDLAAAFSAVYEQGRYARLIRYDSPLPLPLAAEDRAWAEQTARTVVRSA